jgi:hypothetical protein
MLECYAMGIGKLLLETEDEGKIVRNIGPSSAP